MNEYTMDDDRELLEPLEIEAIEDLKAQGGPKVGMRVSKLGDKWSMVVKEVGDTTVTGTLETGKEGVMEIEGLYDMEEVAVKFMSAGLDNLRKVMKDDRFFERLPIIVLKSAISGLPFQVVARALLPYIKEAQKRIEESEESEEDFEVPKFPLLD